MFPVRTRRNTVSPRDSVNPHVSGSVLLISLLVVSLLLLVMIAFSVFVRLELRQVIQHQQLLAARNNARLSASLALAQLQEMTGPDQRITLPAWADGQISASVPVENQNFVGARDSAQFNYVDQGGTPTLQTNVAFREHLGWLASDGENLDPTQYQPFQVNQGILQIDPDSALMVGAGSVHPDTDVNGNGIPDGFVAAPLENLEENGEIQGRYAYWISDEGIKARINSEDPYRGGPTNRWSVAVAQRAAQEWLIPGFDVTNPDHLALANNVYSDPQWELANQEISGTGDESYRHFFHDVTSHSLGMPVNVRRGGLKRDLTAVVEEMAASGGTLDPGSNQGYLDLMDFVSRRRQTQLDESLLLQSTLSEEELDALLPAYALPLREDQITGGNRHQINTKHKLFPPSTWMAENKDIGGPTWRQLLTYMTQFERSGTVSGGVPSVQAGLHSERSHNLSPVVSRWHVNVGYTMDEAGSDYILRMHLMPAISLWNPYNVRLEIPEYFVRIQLNLNAGDGIPLWFRIRHPVWHQNNPNADEGFWAPVYQFAWRQNDGNEGGFSLLLKIPATTLEPGESRWFELGEHKKLEYVDNRNGNAGGFSIPPFTWGNSTGAYNSWGSEYVGRTPGVAQLQVNAHAEADYVTMVPGLNFGGGYSLYLEENFTLRTKIEAGGWRLPSRSPGTNTWVPYTDYTDSDSWAVPSANRNMSIQPDIARYWDTGDTRWRNFNRNRISYPTSFSYRTVDQDSTSPDLTHTFPVLTAPNGESYSTAGTLSNIKTPFDRRRDRGDTTYNYWLEREEGPYDQTWRNRRRFPVRYNESGIIYASPGPAGDPDVDEIPPDDLAVELNGITTDWDILEIRTGFVLERHQGYGPDDDQGYNFGNFSRDPKHGDHVHWGKGRFLMATETRKIDNIRGYQDRTADFFMAGYMPMFPGGFRQDAVEVNTPPGNQSNQAWPMSLLNPDTHPMWGASMSAPLAPDFFGGLLHGLVYSVRMPDHGFIAPSDPHLVLDLPWLGHYNPTSTYVGPDALSTTNFRNIGLKNPPSMVGGLSFDPFLLDPAFASYFNDQNSFIGHSGYTEAYTRPGRDWAGAVLRDIPLSYEDLGSIGQLMHANLQSLGWLRGSDSDPWEHAKSYMIAKDADDGFVGDRYPLYAIGGSLAHPDIPDHQTYRVIWAQFRNFPVEDFASHYPSFWESRYTTGIVLSDFPDVNGGAPARAGMPNNQNAYHTLPMYDVSYWLNDMLWDDFLLSGNANGRLRWQNGIVDRDLNLSAMRITHEGAFNVNSTRVGAWASLLTGFMDLDIHPLDGQSDSVSATDRIPFARTARPFAGGFRSVDDVNTAATYEGYRRLSPEDIWDRNNTPDPSDDSGLAVEIVNVIKERGPFYSLAGFVNRNPLSSNPVHRQMGPLQQAIMQSGINDVLNSGDDAGRVAETDFDMTRLAGYSTPYLWGRHWENIYGQLNNNAAPAAIMQQDILAKIGGGIQVRSDTFKIRAHGRVTDPTGNHVVSQAWCELVVQRRGDYSEPDLANTGDSDGIDTPDELPHELSELNRRFGRRYEVINFRWLAPHEL